MVPARKKSAAVNTKIVEPVIRWSPAAHDFFWGTRQVPGKADMGSHEKQSRRAEEKLAGADRGEVIANEEGFPLILLRGLLWGPVG